MAGATAGIVLRMFRAHSSFPQMVAVVATVGVLTGGCVSDDLVSLTEVPTQTTGNTTEIPVFTTGEPDDITTGGEPDPGTSCRQTISCVFSCVTMIPDPPGPEFDYSCFLECAEDISTEDWLAFIGIADCAYNHCTNVVEQCPDIDDEETCLPCLLQTIGAMPGVSGCESQAIACK